MNDNRWLRSRAAAAAGVQLFRGVLALFLLGCATGGARAANLFELYQRASEFDPTFQAARLERDVADRAVDESRAGVRPVVSATIDASKSYQNIRQSESFLFVEGRTDFFNDGFTISLTQPLYRSQTLERIPQAQAGVRQAASVFDAAKQALIFRLSEAHFNLLAARDNLEFATAERTAIERQLAETEERLVAGLATMTDVHDARGRFALAEASEIQSLDTLEESRQALAEITGAPPSEIARLSAAFPLVTPDRPDVAAWVEAALFQNPVVQARKAAAEIAEKEIRLQRGARLPTVDLVTSYSDRDSGGTEFGGGNEIANSNVAVRIGVPLYDGGRASSLTRSAALRHRIALQELAREKLRVERETRVAFQRVMSGATVVEALTKSVFSYEAALAQKTEGMRAGLNTGLEVLDARRDLFRAKRELTQALYRYVLSSLQLKRSAGVLGVADLQQIDAYLQ